MELSDVLQFEIVASRFTSGTHLMESVVDTPQLLAKQDPSTLFQVGLSVWHQIVSRQIRAVDPQAIAPRVRAADPFLFREIEDLLAIKVIQELHWRQVSIAGSELAEPIVSTTCLAVTFPRDLLIADLFFADPARPRDSVFQEYSLRVFHGLRLLPVLMKRAEEYARQESLDNILLVASTNDLIPLFRRYGFSPDGSEIARQGLANGGGVPMVRPLH